jgi:hypothetical protein
VSAGSFDWFPDWSGQTCVIVAGGPSAKDAPLALAKGRAKVIVINEAYRLAPWADALYAADANWWDRKLGCWEFRGLRVSQSDQAEKKYRVCHVNLVRLAEVVLKPKGSIAAGSDVRTGGANSGFQALNLAAQFGSRRIILVGYDMRIDQGLHWHGRHAEGLANPSEASVRRWRKGFEGAAPGLVRNGVTVLNASPISTIAAFPKVSLEDALAAREAA